MTSSQLSASDIIKALNEIDGEIESAQKQGQHEQIRAEDLGAARDLITHLIGRLKGQM